MNVRRYLNITDLIVKIYELNSLIDEEIFNENKYIHYIHIYICEIYIHRLQNEKSHFKRFFFFLRIKVFMNKCSSFFSSLQM